MTGVWEVEAPAKFSLLHVRFTSVAPRVKPPGSRIVTTRAVETGVYRYIPSQNYAGNFLWSKNVALMVIDIYFTLLYLPKKVSAGYAPGGHKYFFAIKNAHNLTFLHEN